MPKASNWDMVVSRWAADSRAQGQELSSKRRYTVTMLLGGGPGLKKMIRNNDTRTRLKTPNLDMRHFGQLACRLLPTRRSPCSIPEM